MTRDICSQLKWWAENCDRCNGGCQVRGLLKDAAQEIVALRDQQEQNDWVCTLKCKALMEEGMCSHGGLCCLYESQRTIKENEPLTLDELREAAETGDPVWLVGMEDGDGWRRIDYVELLTIGYSCFGDPESWCFRTTGYGVRVFAYRHKPEEGRT